MGRRGQQAFALVLAGLTLSIIGDRIFGVGAAWALSASRRPYLIAFGIASALPMSLLGTLAGSVVDRRRKLPTLIATDLIRAAVVLLPVPVLLLRDAPLVLVAVSLSLSVISLTYFPALNAWMPVLADNGGYDVARLNSSLFVVMGIARLVGPAIAGWLADRLSVPMLLIADGLSFIISAVASWHAGRMLQAHEPPPPGNDQAKGLVARLNEAMIFLSSAKGLLFMVIVFPIIEAVELLLPLLLALALRSDHASGSVYGLLLTSLSAGTLLGALASRFRTIATRGQLVLRLNFLVQGVGIGLLALTWPSLSLASFGLLLMGIAAGMAQVSFSSTIQRLVPRELLGRTFASIGAFAGLLQPVAPLLLGLVPVGYGPVGLKALAVIVLLCGSIVLYGMTTLARAKPGVIP